MSQDTLSWYRYWGKARPEDEGGDRFHLLAFHSLDVAACGRLLIGLPRFSLQPLADALGQPKSVVDEVFIYFLALHDIGKFSRGFQNLAPDLAESLVPSARIPAVRSQRHDTLGWLLWRDYLSVHPGLSSVPDSGHETWRIWARTVMGHHGSPPHDLQPGGQFRLNPADHFLSVDLQAAIEFTQAIGNLLLSKSIPAPSGGHRAVMRQFSWHAAGLAVLADWIGSNQQEFRYRSSVLPVERYWEEVAMPTARKALVTAGLGGARVRHWDQPADLLHEVTIFSPLQQYAADVPLEPVPQLFVLEDVTGSGKTEAALLLTQRMMSAGLAHGFYFALPTMATATQMYARVGKIYRRMFTPESHPSLVLAHSARDMVDDFRASVLRSESDHPTASRNDPGLDASAECAAWLADSRKKALLAEVGVGTIDQALLAVMPVRHQSLRMLGLSGKVLIVDEVHAYDSYMLQLLKVLLEHHARGGGSAILLSATIPQTIRADLLAAFAKGRGSGALPFSLHDFRYPLASQFGSELRLHACATREPLRRSVRVVMLHDEASVTQLIRSEAAKGRCVAWIRNTVEDARRGYQGLVAKCPAGTVTLFHSRYALADRLQIEQGVLARFGVASRGEERCGQVLVGTQVLEQSLDYDVDVMVSDWAPIDLVIQRAGRLMRHRRSLKGDPLAGGSDERGEAILHVLVPGIEEPPRGDWYAALFPKGQYVYDDAGRLWLGADTLGSVERIVTPGMPGEAGSVRALVEAVYGDSAQEVPEALQASSTKADGHALAEQSMGNFNALRLDRGYAIDSNMRWTEDDRVPTRLGEESRTIYLAIERGGVLVPLYDESRRPWEASSVRVDARRFHTLGPKWQERFNMMIDSLRATVPLLREPAFILPLVPDENGVLRGLVQQARGLELEAKYDPVEGLVW